MHVNKIQTTQPNFGTKVKTDFSTLDSLSRSYNLKRHFTKFVEKLENNGRNDIFVITKEVGEAGSHYSAFVYETKPTKKNGYNIHRNSKSLSFQLFGDLPISRHFYKEKIDRINAVYNTCHTDMLEKTFSYKRAGSNI